MLNVTPEQTALTLPGVSVGTGLMMTFKVSLADTHGPTGSFVVSIKLTLPAVISDALGV